MAARHAVLDLAISTEGGEWTTARTLRTYRAAGLDVPNRATARRDLDRFNRMGRLTLCETKGRRHYEPAQGGAR